MKDLTTLSQAELRKMENDSTLTIDERLSVTKEIKSRFAHLPKNQQKTQGILV